MKRLLVLLVAMLAAWFGAGASAPAIAIPANAHCAPVYDYDGGFISATSTRATTERAPPASHDRTSCADAVDRRSHGVSARPDGPTPGEASTYDVLNLLARDASVTTTTSSDVGVSRGDLSSHERAGVAAKSGEDWTRVGRWMHPDEHALMRDTGNIQWSRTSGTHRVSNPATPYAYRDAPASDFYVEYEVPTSVLRPHSEGTSIIYGPNSLQARLPGRAQPGDVPFQNLSEPWW